MRRSVFIIWLFVPLCLFAQEFTPNPDWRFENFNNQNHFVSRSIETIAMDKYGYIWASSRGVQRFDGYHMLDFNRFEQTNGALRDNSASLIADPTGRIWVTSGGLCYYDDAHGRFVYVEADKSHPVTNAFALCILGNNLWFKSDYGLTRLNLHTLKISFTSLKDVPNPLCTYAIDDNTLLVADRERVFIYNIKKDTYTATTLLHNHALIKIFNVIKGRDVIYLGANTGLYTIKNVSHLNALSTPVSNVAIGGMIFMPDDKEKKYLFVATEGKGLLVYNTIKNKVEFAFTHNDGDVYSLPDNVLSNLYLDRTGRLWIGAATGLSMLDRSVQQWKIHFLNKENSGEGHITRIARDKYDTSRIWLSCHYGGMVSVDWKTQKIEHVYNHGDALHDVLDFVQLSRTDWLLVTTNQVAHWNPTKGVTSTQLLPVPDSLSTMCIIRRIIKVNGRICYITSNKGLFKYNIVKHQISAVSVCAPNAKPRDALKLDLLKGFYEEGRLWIASRNGLFTYDVGTGKSQVFSGPGVSSDYFFIDAAEGPDNTVICSGIDGVDIYDPKTGRFSIFNTIDSLYKPSCENVMYFGHKLWIATEAGLISYDFATKRFSKPEHEPAQLEMAPTSPFVIINNCIVTGFANRYAIFNPDKQLAQSPSDPVIENISVNNRSVSQHYVQQESPEGLVFNHRDNSINIGFTSFLYSDPNNIKFRYKLSGSNEKWQNANGERSANFAQLSPGDYTFYVQCGNRNGVWNSHLASVAFTIEPPYWATWWFRLLVLTAVIYLLYQLYRYRIKNLLAIERIREKIASDFHDDIGSALSSISIFSEVADKQLEQHAPAEKTREIIGHISAQSRAMLDAMDDIVWAVNPQNDHINDLAVRMREFAIPLLEARNIHFDISIPKKILSTKIKMSARKNIFMIFKECINNILKHSACTAMRVSVVRHNNQLELIIRDNGKGFNKDTPSLRNGMKNMEKRAEEIDAAIEVITQPGRGTTVKLRVDTI